MDLFQPNFNMYDGENIMKAANIYAQGFHDDTIFTLKAELFIWRLQWNQNTKPKLKFAVNSFSQRINLQLNIKILLHVFDTLPVTSSTI